MFRKLKIVAHFRAFFPYLSRGLLNFRHILCLAIKFLHVLWVVLNPKILAAPGKSVRRRAYFSKKVTSLRSLAFGPSWLLNFLLRGKSIKTAHQGFLNTINTYISRRIFLVFFIFVFFFWIENLSNFICIQWEWIWPPCAWLRTFYPTFVTFRLKQAKDLIKRLIWILSWNKRAFLLHLWK